MGHKPDRAESGQILIVLALALVGLLGFVTLALDLTLVYADRRGAQNAADSAALAAAQLANQALISGQINAANFNCDTAGQWVSSADGWSAPAWLATGNDEEKTWLDKILQAAVSQAAAAGYTFSAGEDDEPAGFDLRCSTTPESTLDVRVVISAVTTTSLLHLFYQGPVINTVNAVARIRPTRPAYAGYAVVATDSDCSAGGVSGPAGSSLTLASGASMLSFSCINAGSITAKGGSINYLAGAHSSATGSFSPAAQMLPAGWVSQPSLPDPSADCAALPANPPLLDGAYQPGRYTGGLSGGSLLPGLYCISGGIALSAGHDSLSSIPDSGGLKGVTLYLLSGGFTCSGACSVSLDAPATQGTVPAHTVRGLAVLAQAGSGQGWLTGDSSQLQINGSVIFPDGEVDLSANQQSDSYTQWVGRSVHLSATAPDEVYYSSSTCFQVPASLELLR